MYVCARACPLAREITKNEKWPPFGNTHIKKALHIQKMLYVHLGVREGVREKELDSDNPKAQICEFEIEIHRSVSQ